MIETLQRIVQEVNAADSLAQALDIIVQRVKQSLSVDVCSVYLVTPGQQELVLMATEGLRPESKYKVRLKFSEGLVGLVAERAETINLEHAQDHPRFKYIPETGESAYHAFLGIPIIHHRELLGVLVAQQCDARRFDDDHSAFLFTLAAQLASAISHAEVTGEIHSLRGKHHRDVFIKGVSGSNGIAFGTAFVIYSDADIDTVPDREPENIDDEIQRFEKAIDAAQSELLDLKKRLGATLPSEEVMLFDAFMMLLGSDALLDRTIEHIREGNWAPGALRMSIRESTHVFEEMEDAYIRERADDIRDLGNRVLMHLQQTGNGGMRAIPDSAVLIGHKITVTELAEIPPGKLAAVVSESGSSSSHVAILARAMGVPAVMGATDLPVGRLDGSEVLVDGYTGRVYIQPSAQVKSEFQRLASEEAELSEELKSMAFKEAITPDGVHVPVYVNGGLMADVDASENSGSEGIGLYRTEFPFMVRERFPGEEEQYQIYRKILMAVAPRPVTLRTLDVGGDKALSYFPVNEENPFLGWRGIRITLDHPEIFLTQLRAMLRASVGLNNLKILLPMITSTSEVEESLELVQRAWYELLDEDVNAIIPDVGVMVEVPSAVYMIEEIARRVDFISVGTNDLIQYLLAVDRNNARVAGMYHAMHPAVLRALIHVIDGTHRVGKQVSICGEMAGDPAAVILLLGMGIDSLSVSLAGIPRVKWVIHSFSRDHARGLLEQSLKLEDPEAIRALLNASLVEAGLGGLVRAGKH